MFLDGLIIHGEVRSQFALRKTPFFIRSTPERTVTNNVLHNFIVKSDLVLV